MRPLDGLRDVFLFALSQSRFTPAEKKMFVMRWNSAIRDFEKHYEIKSKKAEEGET